MKTKRAHNFKDRTGETFNELTLVKYIGNRKWLCKCSCGKKTTVRISDLLRSTKSCGHLRTKHNRKGTPEYITWQKMKYRCYNPNSNRYHRYGGRGISVCKEWRDSFIKFFEDMGLKPTPRHSIHRLDNDGNYEKKNCRWASPKEQMEPRKEKEMSKSTLHRVYKYPQEDVVEFQRRVIDLANEIPRNIQKADELLNIARALKEIAYNRPIRLPK